MTEEDKYVSLRLKWDKDIEAMKKDFISEFNVINKDYNYKELKDDIYRFLTNKGYDDKSYKLVYDSVKITKPNLTYASFIRDYAYRDVGNIKSIDNKHIADKLFNAITKSLMPLQGRFDRLESYKKGITLIAVNGSISDVKRIVNTNTTVVNNLKSSIKEKTWILKRSGITEAERRDIEADIKLLNNELKSAKKSQKTLTKKLNKFTKSYETMSEVKLKKDYDSLLTNIQTDIITKQQPSVLNKTFNSSASYPSKSFAQTEMIDTVSKKDVKEFKQEDKDLGRKQTLLVRYTLSASHNIIDICDEHADKDSGYGKGVYEIDEAPVPIRDTHPNCKCRLRKYGRVNSKGLIEVTE